MISDKLISEKYASMPDGELLDFAREEGHHLTSEGLRLLQAELRRRNLSTGIDSIIKEKTAPDIIEEYETHQFSSAAWAYTFEEKGNGKYNDEILAGLVETGLEDADARGLLSQLEIRAGKELQRAEVWRLTGVLILISGIALTFLPATNTSNPLTKIIAWCMILYGTGKAIKGLYYKAKFRKVLRNIQLEKNGHSSSE